ncbi:MAG TPA: hypothetical protein VNH18_18475 [Bryobacteraceae bacterium]|nr:hypothetical protein [Bryobacteraceae bacterium]
MADPTDQAVATALADRGAPPHIVQGGAAGLIRRWRDFVSQVEAGYPLGLDEYRNDLDLRSLIAFVGLASRVQAEDARFRAVLVAPDTAIWSSDAPEAWWTRGYPGNSGPLLREDLQAEGLL